MKQRRPLRVGEWYRQTSGGIVIVPVRVVGREHEPIPANPFDDVAQMGRRLWFFHRLRGEPDVAADDFRWKLLHRGILGSDRLPVAVHPPGMGGNPREAGFHEDDPQVGEFVEHAFNDHAGDDRLAAGRMADHFLDIE